MSVGNKTIPSFFKLYIGFWEYLVAQTFFNLVPLQKIKLKSINKQIMKTSDTALGRFTCECKNRAFAVKKTCVRSNTECTGYWRKILRRIAYRKLVRRTRIKQQQISKKTRLWFYTKRVIAESKNSLTPYRMEKIIKCNHNSLIRFIYLSY